MVFTRYSTKGPGNSLYLIEDGEAFSEAVVISSERLDGDPGWRQVPDRSVLSVGPEGVTVRSL